MRGCRSNSEREGEGRGREAGKVLLHEVAIALLPPYEPSRIHAERDTTTNTAFGRRGIGVHTIRCLLDTV